MGEIMKIGYRICGLIHFSFKDDIDRWVIKKVYLSKHTLTSSELLKAKGQLINEKQHIDRLSNKKLYGSFDIEIFKSINNFKNILKEYKQPISVINHYISRIKKKI